MFIPLIFKYKEWCAKLGFFEVIISSPQNQNEYGDVLRHLYNFF